MVDTLFLGSLVQSRCGEGGMLQTDNTGVCLQCLSHAGPGPAHSPHSSGSRLLHQEPSEAGPGLHAPPRSEPRRLRHSGSPQSVLCPSQVRAAQVSGERGRCDLSPVPSLLPSLLGVPPAPLLRRTVTVQDPRSLSQQRSLLADW